MKNLITLAVLILMVVSIATATIATETVMAKKYKTGTSAVERGAHDATQCTTQDESNCSPLYIEQPGKGFADHSKEFNKNYIKGYCAAGGGGSDADETTFDCSRDNN
jgi:hypothetical protein